MPDGRLRVVPRAPLVVPRGVLDLGRGCAAGARRRLPGETPCVRKPERLERVVVPERFPRVALPELGVRKVRAGVARLVRLPDRFAGRLPVVVGVRKVRGVLTRSEFLERVVGRAVVAAGFRGVRVGVMRLRDRFAGRLPVVVGVRKVRGVLTRSEFLERVVGRVVVAAGVRGVRVGVARSVRFPDRFAGRLPVLLGVRKVRVVVWLSVRSCGPLLVVALRIVLDGPRLTAVPERPALNLRAAARPVALLRRITFVSVRPTSSCARCGLTLDEAARGRALGVRAARRITPRGRRRAP